MRTHQIRLSPYGKGGFGIKTEIDGKEIPEVGLITFSAPPDGIAKLELELFVPHDFDLQAEAVVRTRAILQCETCDYWDKPLSGMGETGVCNQRFLLGSITPATFGCLGWELRKEQTDESTKSV